MQGAERAVLEHALMLGLLALGRMRAKKQ